jgi:uncharacterized protein YqhQ
MPFLPIGGQAVIEGVMMRSPSRMAVAVRRPDGSVGLMERPFVSITQKVRALRLPVIRGAVSLFETLYLGISALNYSADEAAREPDTAPDHKTPWWQSLVQGLTVLLSLGLGILLFVVLPAKLTSWLGFHDRVGFGLVDGLFRLLAFLLYLILISQWKEMARVLMYHGAEHKAIHAIENRAPLTPESVQSFSRFHPRCGTSFLFLVVVISIVVFTFIGRPTSIWEHLLRVACMPVIAGVAFEFIRFSGKYYDHAFVKAVVWPGMQFQRLTTREPDLSMCEVAIVSLEAVRGDEQVVKLEQHPVAKPEMAFIQ